MARTYCIFIPISSRNTQVNISSTHASSRVDNEGDLGRHHGALRCHPSTEPRGMLLSCWMARGLINERKIAARTRRLLPRWMRTRMRHAMWTIQSINHACVTSRTQQDRAFWTFLTTDEASLWSPQFDSRSFFLIFVRITPERSGSFAQQASDRNLLACTTTVCLLALVALVLSMQACLATTCASRQAVVAVPTRGPSLKRPV